MYTYRLLIVIHVLSLVCELGLLAIGIMVIIDNISKGAAETSRYITLAVVSFVTTVISFMVNLFGARRLMELTRESIRIHVRTANCSSTGPLATGRDKFQDQ
jgi:hypothetical protein